MYNIFNTISLFTVMQTESKCHVFLISVCFIKCTPACCHGDGAETSWWTAQGVSDEEKHVSRIHDVPGKRGQKEVLQQSCDCRARTLIDILLQIWRRNNVLLWNRGLWALDGVVDSKNEQQVIGGHTQTDVH